MYNLSLGCNNFDHDGLYLFDFFLCLCFCTQYLVSHQASHIVKNGSYIHRDTKRCQCILSGNVTCIYAINNNVNFYKICIKINNNFLMSFVIAKFFQLYGLKDLYFFNTI